MAVKKEPLASRDNNDYAFGFETQNILTKDGYLLS
jgi:hypothetical protein